MKRTVVPLRRACYHHWPSSLECPDRIHANWALSLLARRAQEATFGSIAAAVVLESKLLPFHFSTLFFPGPDVRFRFSLFNLSRSLPVAPDSLTSLILSLKHPFHSIPSLKSDLTGDLFCLLALPVHPPLLLEF